MLANIGYRVNDRMDVGAEVFWMPAETADGTVRTTHFNSWNYPVVHSAIVVETFATTTAARTHAKEHFGAEPGQFASK